MIPRTIELKNFLSYGETVQTIDFKNYNLICLSGKNGNGKSALLDALTWALWGQARKIAGTSKADEGLLRIGQTRMMVSVEFEFGQQIYRVRREFAKTYGKPYSALDFEVFDATRGAYASLTDKTVRTTQEKIEQLLGLDYETFINTSFLRQGQANEFSKKTPKERKQVLSSILGFSKYDILQQQALEQSRKQLDEKKLLTQLIEQSKQELEQEPFLKDSLAQEQLAAETMHQQIKTITQAITEKEEELRTLSAFQNQLIHLEQEIIATNQKYTQRTTTLQPLIQAWKHTHNVTLFLPNHHELETKKQELLKQEKNFLELRAKNITIQEHELALKQKIQAHQATLTQELEKNIYAKRLELEKQKLHVQQQQVPLEQKKKLLQELAQKHTTLTEELTTLKTTKTVLEQKLSSFQEYKKQFEKRRAFYQMLVSKGNWLKTALQESDHKKRIVEDLSNPACPLCEQVLTAKRKQFLGAKLITHEHFLHHQIGRIGTIIRKLKALLLEQHTALEQQEKEMESLRQLGEQERLLTSTLEQITPACDLLVTEIIELQKQIDTGTQAYEKQKTLLITMEKEGREIIAHDRELQNLSQQLMAAAQDKQACMYDQKAYEHVQEQLRELSQVLDTIGNLATEKEQQTIRRTHIRHLITELKEIKKEQEQQKTKKHLLETQLIREKPAKQELTTLTQELHIQREKKEHNARQQARLEADLKRIDILKQANTTKLDQITKLDQEIDDYQTLAQALGKNGLQALLIEEAVPEIEQEANRLLANLTDNQAQIFIESLRDLKSGGVKETLDIHISDSAGIRPYEMYSGGEAFRVDFALRIAISKLLAQRAGTALQTIIIDEGFGSQDEEGLARITESLYTIKDHFAKIIIVSHLPEMKDSFPVHFIVEKQSSGSIVTVEERG